MNDQITYDDKVENGGTTNTGLCTAADMNMIKNVVNAHAGVVVPISQKSDLPTPVGGVITLVAGKIYFFTTFVTIDTDHIDLNGARIEGYTPALSGIIYTGTAAAIFSASGSVNVNNILVQAVNGKLFDCNGGGGTSSFNANTLVSTSCVDVGDIEDFQFFTMVRCSFQNATGRGIIYTGVFNIVVFRNSLAKNNAGILHDFNLITDVDVINVNACEFDIPSGATGISNVSGSANVKEVLRLENNNFSGDGLYVTTDMRCDPVALFFGNVGNSGTEDSLPKAAAYIAPGAETPTIISALNDPVVIAGTWTLKPDVCKFDDNGNPGGGQLRYTGKMTSTETVAYKMFLDPVSGNNRTYWVYIRVYRWDPIGETYDPPVKDDQSQDIVTVDAANPGKIVGFTELVVHEKDYFELVVEHKSGGSGVDVTASSASTVITS